MSTSPLNEGCAVNVESTEGVAGVSAGACCAGFLLSATGGIAFALTLPEWT
jgi:hypothetical protein